MEKDREGEYVVQLFKDGAPYATRSLTCGPKTFKDSCAQWRRNGFRIEILRQPTS